MNAGLQTLVGNWFSRGDHDMPDDQDIPPPIPKIAILPMPEQTEEEKRLKVIADAHGYVEQIKQERLADRKTIEQLQAEVESLAHQLQGEIRKSGLLELDLATAQNNIETREADFQGKERCLELLWEVLVKFNTKLPTKPERKSKKKKADRESATGTAKAAT